MTNTTATEGTDSDIPRVVFACVRNGGRSVISRVLTEHYASGRVAAVSAGTQPGEHIHAQVDSAGTRPGTSLNDLSVRRLHEVGVDISTEVPKPVTSDLMRAADLAVTLGREASVEPVEGTRVENWDTDEPSTRGMRGSSACVSYATTSQHASGGLPATSASIRSNVWVVTDPARSRRLTKPCRVPAYSCCDGEDPAN